MVIKWDKRAFVHSLHFFSKPFFLLYCCCMGCN
jgi:hypothetical protein